MGGTLDCKDSLEKMAIHFERCILGQKKTWIGRSPALVWNVILGVETHPIYQQELENLMSWVRKIRKDIITGKVADKEALGRIDCTAEKWRWTTSKGTARYKTEWGMVDLTECSRAVTKQVTKKGVR